MPGSSASSSAAPPASAAAATASSSAAPGLGDNKGIKFQITSGGQRWACTLQDRSSYERTKAARTNSMDSVDSSASGSS